MTFNSLMPGTKYLPFTSCFVISTEVTAALVDSVIGQMHVNVALQHTALVQLHALLSQSHCPINNEQIRSHHRYSVTISK